MEPIYKQTPKKYTIKEKRRETITNKAVKEEKNQSKGFQILFFSVVVVVKMKKISVNFLQLV